MPNVRVGPSPKHGNGVFAVRVIKKHEKITQYLADLIFRKEGADYRLVTKGSYAASVMQRMTDEQLLNYMKDLENGTHVVGDPEKFSPEKCAHLINDAVDIGKINRHPTAENFGREALNYLLRSSSSCNCILKVIGGKCWAVALRDIAIGEELLTSYDYRYWVLTMTQEEMMPCMREYVGGLTPGQQALFGSVASRMMQHYDR